MADLTLSDVFGDAAVFDGDAATITFSLGDLSVNEWEITPDVIDEYASKILWAILTKVINDQPETNNDDTRLVYITNQGKRTALRNGVSQFSFGLLASGYVNDPLGTELNPNDLGTANDNQGF